MAHCFMSTTVTSTETCYHSQRTFITFTGFCWGKPKGKEFPEAKNTQGHVDIGTNAIIIVSFPTSESSTASHNPTQ
jgi:hypothetical protein